MTLKNWVIRLGVASGVLVAGLSVFAGLRHYDEQRALADRAYNEDIRVEGRIPKRETLWEVYKAECEGREGSYSGGDDWNRFQYDVALNNGTIRNTKILVPDLNLNGKFDLTEKVADDIMKEVDKKKQR